MLVYNELLEWLQRSIDSMLVQTFDAFEFIINDNPRRRENKDILKSYSNKAGRIRNLQFIRHVPFDRINDYFQRAKILVNTSDSEGFPNTFIQACNCGAAILSFNVNPDGFLDTHKCGLCCNGDAAWLTYNMRFLLEADRYVEFGSNARKYSEKYHDITRIAGEYKSIFSKFVGTG